jgi:hypothetical protein
MKIFNRQHFTPGGLCLTIIILVCGGYVIFPAFVEAAMTVQSFNGPVQVILKEEGNWKPVTDKIQLQAGDQIMTEAGGSVVLLGEDGSELQIGEKTQVAISELDFSTTRKTRVSRFKLFWGKLTAKAAKYDYQNNTFNVETDTVVAGFKFSQMTIIAPPQDDESPTKLMPLEGKFEFKQTNTGKTAVDCRLNDDRAGIAFPIESVGTTVEMQVQPPEGKIALESSVPLQNLCAILSTNFNALDVENLSGAPSLEGGFLDNSVRIEPGASVSFGIPPDKADQEIKFAQKLQANQKSQGKTEGTDPIFVFSRRTISGGKFLMCANRGTIILNGHPLKRGACADFPIGGEQPPIQQTPTPVPQETPVIPPPPEEPPKEHVGSPILPK